MFDVNLHVEDFEVVDHSMAGCAFGKGGLFAAVLAVKTGEVKGLINGMAER